MDNKTPRQIAAERNARGVCIRADEHDEDVPIRSLGLCDPHYQQYIRERRKIATKSEKAAELFDEALIEMGKLIRGPRIDNIYAEVAQKILTAEGYARDQQTAAGQTAKKPRRNRKK